MPQFTHVPHAIALAAVLVLLPVARVEAQGAAPCTAQPACTAVSSFTATVTDLRTSTYGSARLVTIVARFRNTTPRPLVLGYVDRSGSVTDDQGNIYHLAGPPRGISTITRHDLDASFVLQPGESADGRFEFRWHTQGIAGTVYELDLAVREIEPVAGNQYRLGREHALNFRGLAPSDAPVVAPVVASAPAPAVTSAPGGAVAATPVAMGAPSADACGGNARCYHAGPFTAEVFQVTKSTRGSLTQVRLGMRVRNLTGAPLVLGYSAGSAVLIDDRGNRYVYGDEASGIGIVRGSSADPQFVLRPGESRDATFESGLHTGSETIIGTAYNYDLALDQLEVMPSGQVRSVRQYNASFRDLREGGSSPLAAPAMPTVEDAAGRLFDAIRKRVSKPKPPPR